MKQLIFLFLVTLSLSAFSQDKKSFIHFNKFTVVEGTEFVIATVEEYKKMGGNEKTSFLFINTTNGESTTIELPNNGSFQSIEQIKIDSLQINQIIVSARCVDINKKSGIDWTDPRQIFVFSTNGKEKKQLTDDNLFVSTYIVNRQTGSIVITGYYDLNKNNKQDKEDKNEILIYNLKTLKLISKK